MTIEYTFRLTGVPTNLGIYKISINPDQIISENMKNLALTYRLCSSENMILVWNEMVLDPQKKLSEYAINRKSDIILIEAKP